MQKASQNVQESSSQGSADESRRSTRFRWWRSSITGYFASFFLVGALLIIEKIDELVPHAPIFVGTPFALISVLAALIWGLGPALVAFVLGLIVVIEFFSPDVLSTDFLHDAAIIGPFTVLQLVAIATVIKLERARQRLLAARQELASAHEELLASHKQLEQAVALKDYVMTRAAHELRTPLTTILGRTQLLSSRLNKSGETPENWAALKNYLEVIEVRALHMRALIENLFDLSRIHAKIAPLEKRPCDLGNLCRKVVEAQRVSSGRIIELELPAQDIMLQADDKRLSQVLVNLLSNAIKYSQEDSVIYVRVSSEDTHALLLVHNAYPELAPEQLKRLFEPFYRASNVEYSSIQGWGLGLTLAKEIVEQHGGQIEARSTQGNGITFVVRLPCG